MVTTTAIKLHDENETRIFSIPINDTQQQTKDILRALADDGDKLVNLDTWHALQRWIEGAEHRCVIPFGPQLAELVPAVAVRLRRDFGAILALIKTHAILHQANRARDKQGCIIATLKDYEAVRELVADLVAEGAEVTVSSSVQETVAAVEEILNQGNAEASVADVKKRLNFDHSTAWRRVQAAITLGYLKNLEDRERRPAKLILGDPLPQEEQILPTVEQLQDCAIASEEEEIDIPPSPNLESNDSELEVVEL